MSVRSLAAVVALAFLSGCASMFPPSPESLAALPVVTFPAAPPTGDFILKLPGGQPIPSHVIIEGSALSSGADQTLTVTLPRDLYVHKRWVSEDGRSWKRFDEVLEIQLAVSLPSDEYPKPGEIRLRVDRRNAK